MLVSIWAATEATQGHFKHPFPSLGVHSHDLTHQICHVMGFYGEKLIQAEPLDLTRTELDQA